jgi:hypothetical protein
VTKVIYTRVPDQLKDAVDAHAEERGVTLSSAIVDVLERGLTAVSDEKSLAALEAKLADASARSARLESELRSAKAEVATVAALGTRAASHVGRCPTCTSPISGYDLFASGECPSCRAPLSGLLASTSRSKALDQREFLMLIGALGAVVGLALVAGK